MNQILQKKYEALKQYLQDLESVVVAYSSGVDSTFLLYAAKEALGDNLIAVTAASDFFPKRELEETKVFCEEIGVQHRILYADELEVEGIAENPTNRCYLCKKDLFGKFVALAKECKMAAVVEGSNVDDEGDYRPGMQAIAELGIKSPLRAVRFTKAEIRELSREFGLSTWEKPSFACLASRFPYGEIITKEKLHKVEEAEQLLLDLGFQQFRVRIHGEDLARIELLPSDFEAVMKDETRELIYEKLRRFGFAYVSLDLRGYRTGSLNEVL